MKPGRNDDGGNAAFHQSTHHLGNMSVYFNFVEIRMNLGDITAGPKLNIPPAEFIICTATGEPVVHVSECDGIPDPNPLMNVTPGIGSPR
jgi:hypothetical protein